ncbi:MAG: OmpA family protein [Gemmatimonadales bacterium]
MASPLLESLEALVTPEVLSRTSRDLGESEANIARGFSSAFGGTLAGLTSRASDAGFMRQILELVGSKANDGRILDDPSALFSGPITSPAMDLGSKFLTSVFGGRTSGVTDLIGRTAGLRPQAASSIMSMIGPLVLAVLGRLVRSRGLDASGLASALLMQREDILRAAPPGLNNVLGLAGAAPAAVAARSPAPSGRRWLLPLLAAAALALILWSVLRGGRARDTVDDAVGAMEETAVETGNAVRSAAADASNWVEQRLPDGVNLNVPPTGIESRLVGFITDPDRPVDRTTWFEFDRLTFETGSATVRPESKEQLDNIAAILKAYPSVTVKIGGYTDNTGDDAANLKLSQDRASAVERELVTRGAADDRIEAEGYGEQHPVADNSTEEGRAKNRRIALRVTAK